MSNICDYLKNNKDQISSAAAILGILVGLGGFSVTWHQLRLTTNMLKASHAYEIQKDARQLISELNTTQFRSALSHGLPMDISDRQDVLDNLWIMMNFYLSVYRQDSGGGLSEPFVNAFKDDFCGFIQNSTIHSGWTELSSNGRIGDQHKEMRRSWCDS